MTQKMYSVIEDLRTNKIYLDATCSMIRLFEEVLEREMSLEEAKRKYPKIIVLDDL
jgi:hypothetical protein|tara:strand:+ start:335 stop:502 length:168 start_codon:yes stop_codon:yes gene_type:complete